MLTTQQGSFSNEAIDVLMDTCMDEIIRSLIGKPLSGQVNRRELEAEANG